MLKLQSNEPFWLEFVPADGDIAAVRVQFAPIGPRAVRLAREAIRKAYAAGGDDGDAGEALSAQLIRSGLRAWEGIGDSDGNPAPLTPETIEVFINDPRTFEAADRLYVGPWARRDSEKNALSGSPNGISAGATPGKTIAAKPAAGRTTAGARAMKKSASKRAPMPVAKRPATKARPSGK